MDFPIVCGTWIKEADEKVLQVLQAAETMPSVAELSQKTGLSPQRVEHTLRMLAKQTALAKTRNQFLQDL